MNILERMIPRPYYMAEGDGAGADGDGGDGDAAAAAAAAAAADKGDKGDGDDAGAADKGDKSGDWRTSLYDEGDADAEKFLQRFNNPKAFTKSALEAQKALRSGKRDIPPPDGEKDPEGMARWREERGLPETPDGYEIDPKVAERFTDVDKPYVDSFLESAHKNNMDPASVQMAVSHYIEMQDAADNERKVQDEAQAEEFETVLRKEWGGDYKAMTGMAMRVATAETPGLDWTEARMPDGRKLGNVPEFAKAMASLGSLKYGDPSLITQEAVRASESRLEELQTMRKDKGMEWWDAPAQKALRDEREELVSKQLKKTEITGE